MPESLVQVEADPVVRTPRTLGRLVRQPVAILCLAYIAAVAVIAVVAPLVWPEIQTQHAGNLLEVLQGPSREHLLGTDALGRDVLKRLLVGTRVTSIGVIEALAVVLLLGVPFGLAAGFVGGWTDRVVGWLADLTFSMPSVIVILVVLSVFPKSMLAAMVTFGVLAAPGLMRVVRSATLPVKTELYVAAARVSGLSRRRIVLRHILPRIVGPIIVQASLIAAVALLVQTGFSFLNLIVAAPAPSWGGLVADGLNALLLQPWLIWPSGITIAITVVAFGLLGDSIRDANAGVWAAAPHRRSRASRRRRPDRGVAPVMPRAGDALLSLQGVDVDLPSRDSSVAALRNVTFDVAPGEIVGLVGESGCGKTMTAMAVLGLLPAGGEVVTGRIEFAGRDIAGLGPRALNRIRGREIGFVSQEPMASFNPSIRVGRQVAECVRLHRGLSRRETRAEVLRLFERVHLADPAGIAQSYPHELSGGMAQRVAIARALAGQPRLLIADEPTTALDVTVQAEILALLRELQREQQTAILFVTHDWGVVAQLCDRVVVMYAGEIVERAGVEAIFEAPLHPYTEALLASNPYGLESEEWLPTISGTVPALGMWPAGCHFHPRCPYATAECAAHPISIERPAPARETRCIHYDQMALHR